MRHRVEAEVGVLDEEDAVVLVEEEDPNRATGEPGPLGGGGEDEAGLAGQRVVRHPATLATDRVTSG